MNFILVALIISALTGEPVSYQRMETYKSPEECLAAQQAQNIERVTDGKVTVYGCVREDQFGQGST